MKLRCEQVSPRHPSPVSVTVTVPTKAPPPFPVAHFSPFATHHPFLGSLCLEALQALGVKSNSPQYPLPRIPFSSEGGPVNNLVSTLQIFIFAFKKHT